MRTALLAFVLVASATSAFARTAVSKTGGVQVDIPDSWKGAAKDDTLLIAADPSEDIALIFSVQPKQDTAKSIAALEKIFGDKIKKDTWEKPQDFTLNGMKGVSIDGKGVVAGHDALLSLVILATPNGHTVLIFGAMKAGTEAKHAAEILSIVKSLKPS